MDIYKKERELMEQAKKDGCAYISKDACLYSDFDLLLSDLDMSEEDYADNFPYEDGRSDGIMWIAYYGEFERIKDVRAICADVASLSDVIESL